MTEFIGSRISLISKRDIRYVGTLHEISSENSTVALEQVVSFGTEGRRLDDEVPPSDNVYEYIVFRGSDVKDLRIEEPPKENKPPKPPQVPDDPAILGSQRRPTPSKTPKAPSQVLKPQHAQEPQQTQFSQRPAPPQLPQQPPYSGQNYYPPPQNHRFGSQGFPPGPGFPGMPYGPPPPGWYPPPGYGFPHLPSQFHSNQIPIGRPPSQQNRVSGQLPQEAIPNGTSINDLPPTSQEPSPAKPTATVKLPSVSSTPMLQNSSQIGPPPPNISKPNVAAALAPPTATSTQSSTAPIKPVPTGPKSGRIVPAIPLPSPGVKQPIPANDQLHSTAASTVPSVVAPNAAKPTVGSATQIAPKSLEDASRDARAAVAAAMAKLPPTTNDKSHGEGALDNLTKKVNEMRTNDNIRTSRQPGTGGYAAGHRAGGGRAGYRASRPHADSHSKKVEIPIADYDFVSANARFNKQDLVKEAIATGSPVGLPGEIPSINGSSTEASAGETLRAREPSSTVSATVGYNKTSSFFDNISSESRDRGESGATRLGGREFRSEEQKKNLETFGAGSVDNGRGAYRGRGRGRGYGRGRGGYTGRSGRGNLRGSSRGVVAAET